MSSENDPYTVDILTKWIKNNVIDDELAAALMKTIFVGVIALQVCCNHGLKKEFDEEWKDFMKEEV